MPFADAATESIFAEGHGNCAILKMLARFLRLPLQEGVCANPTITISEEVSPDGWSEWTNVLGFKGRLFWKPEEMRFHFQIPAAKKYAIIPILRRVFNLAALRRTIFGKTVFAHGALLFFPDTGKAVVLFGHSGIGKSTASERFVRQGGSYLSDDKMLLTFKDDGALFAQPAPTWSRFGVRELDVDFSTSAPVSSLLWLSRGDGDRIQTADPVQWRLTLVKSFSNVLEYPCNWLPTDLVRTIMDKSISMIPQLVARFGTYELLGDLNGNIHDNLKAFLHQLMESTIQI